jgi:hypothetical protein
VKNEAYSYFEILLRAINFARAPSDFTAGITVLQWSTDKAVVLCPNKRGAVSEIWNVNIYKAGCLRYAKRNE